jgi:hypothetical protein
MSIKGKRWKPEGTRLRQAVIIGNYELSTPEKSYKILGKKTAYKQNLQAGRTAQRALELAVGPQSLITWQGLSALPAVCEANQLTWNFDLQGDSFVVKVAKESAVSPAIADRIFYKSGLEERILGVPHPTFVVKTYQIALSNWNSKMLRGMYELYKLDAANGIEFQLSDEQSTNDLGFRCSLCDGSGIWVDPIREQASAVAPEEELIIRPPAELRKTLLREWDCDSCLENVSRNSTIMAALRDIVGSDFQFPDNGPNPRLPAWKIAFVGRKAMQRNDHCTTMRAFAMLLALAAQGKIRPELIRIFYVQGGKSIAPKSDQWVISLGNVVTSRGTESVRIGFLSGDSFAVALSPMSLGTKVVAECSRLSTEARRCAIIIDPWRPKWPHLASETLDSFASTVPSDWNEEFNCSGHTLAM